jgi:hypothetical protein
MFAVRLAVSGPVLLLIGEKSTDAAKREVGAVAAALRTRGSWCWRDSSTSPTSWTLRTPRSTCWSSCTARRRAPADSIIRPLVTGWGSAVRIAVGDFMISSALATRDEPSVRLNVLNQYRRLIEPMGALPAQRTRSRGRPGPQPTSRTRSPAWSRRSSAERARRRIPSDLPSVRKRVDAGTWASPAPASAGCRPSRDSPAANRRCLDVDN